MTIIFAMSDNFCIFAVEKELTLMLRQNGHLPGTAGDTACDQRGANSLIITPPQFAGIVNGKGENPIFIVGLSPPCCQRAYTGVRPYGGGAALFCPCIEIHENSQISLINQKL